MYLDETSEQKNVHKNSSGVKNYFANFPLDPAIFSCFIERLQHSMREENYRFLTLGIFFIV